VALNAVQIRQIVAKIRRGLCVPFLGAAANRSCAGYEGLPLGADVSKLLAAELAHHGVRDDTNLPRVSLIYELTVRRDGLIDKLRQLLPEGRQPSRLLTTLASFPLDLYITTNYDSLLEDALQPRAPLVVVQTSAGIEEPKHIDDWLAADPRPPLVYKIHGTFRPPAPPEPGAHPVDTSPLIITEDDYIDFLTILGSELKGLPRPISLRLKSSTILFLGYSLEDWDLRVLHKTMMNSFADKRFRPACYSVQKNPADYWTTFWNEQGVTIIDHDVYEFADALKAEFVRQEAAGA
jgi:SIR2-like domain